MTVTAAVAGCLGVALGALKPHVLIGMFAEPAALASLVGAVVGLWGIAASLWWNAHQDRRRADASERRLREAIAATLELEAVTIAAHSHALLGHLEGQRPSLTLALASMRMLSAPERTAFFKSVGANWALLPTEVTTLVYSLFASIQMNQHILQSLDMANPPIDQLRMIATASGRYAELITEALILYRHGRSLDSIFEAARDIGFRR